MNEETKDGKGSSGGVDAGNSNYFTDPRLSIVQAIGHPVLILDREARILTANREVESITGRKAEELTGRHCYEIMHGTDEMPPGCPFRKMLQSSAVEREIRKYLPTALTRLVETEADYLAALAEEEHCKGGERLHLAMSSHRPYRPMLGQEAARGEIEKNSGVLYDPQCVAVCLRLFREERFQWENFSSKALMTS